MQDEHIGRIDLEACDREPIHYIGSIQPHGALLAADAATRDVVFASENIHDFIGLDVDGVLARPLADVIGAGATDHLLAQSLAPTAPESSAEGGRMTPPTTESRLDRRGIVRASA